MALWPQIPTWYDLRQLNGGTQFTPTTPVTSELWSRLVQNLIYLYNRVQGGVQNGNVAE